VLGWPPAAAAAVAAGREGRRVLELWGVGHPLPLL